VGHLAEVFESNIYLDPLTGMPNFFKFIEADVEAMFGEHGSVIVFDMANFQYINDTYGREVGDLFLKSFAGVLRDALVQFTNVLEFRTHGDEFTVIIKNMNLMEAKKLGEEVRKTFKETMASFGFFDADIHMLLLDYADKITSVNQFYKMLFKKSIEEWKLGQKRFSEERIIENVVGNFTNRIKETLSLLNDAYSLALTDDISCLPNQRAAKIFLKGLIKEREEMEKEFSILFIDGDNLKRYNNISYSKGNEMIKELSGVIAASLRKNDKIFRWLTGDEFLVILDNVNNSQAVKLADRIRSSVEEQTKFWLYPITVSIGIASYPVDGSNIEVILSKAEKANVYAKNTGKNKVIKWESGLDDTVKESHIS
jgi:diguanylate cyclase (GGDEF)-like protein